MKLEISLAAALAGTLLLSGCGGGGSSASITPTEPTYVGYLIDSAVGGADYSGDRGSSGVTGADGSFRFLAGENVTFTLGAYPLGSVALRSQDSEAVLTPIDLIQGEVVQNDTSGVDTARLDTLLRLLQTADDNGNPQDGISISAQTKKVISDTLQSHTGAQDAEQAAAALQRTVVSAEDARAHFEESLHQLHGESTSSYISSVSSSSKSSERSSSSKSSERSSSSSSTYVSSSRSSSSVSSTSWHSVSSEATYEHVSSASYSSVTSDEDEDEHDDEHDGSSSSVTSYGSSSSAFYSSAPSSAGASSSSVASGPVASGDYTLLAWNDLGMHCMDGKDFSVFSILPPYNTLNAQLISKAGTSNKHITSGVTITYSAAPSLLGQWNTTSLFDNANNPKTNFWDYAAALFNTSLTPDIGLTGNPVTESTPHNFTYNSAHSWWEATGIPLTPYNDDGSKNYYPMAYVTAKDNSGAVLATTQVVLPVSDEMDCRACHGSTSGYDSARPAAGWENDADAERDFKYNILRLHDQKYPTAVSDNQAALQGMGYMNYDNAGLYASAKNGNPPLCATCHASNALPGTGIAGIKPLTESLHAMHANVTDPTNGQTLASSTNRSSCYRCHPGATTKCLRGAMGKISSIQCQNCHGNMNAVGTHGRNGWLEEPNCQSCHQEGVRHSEAVTNQNTGTLRAALDTRFATNANTPASGISLYRFSKGHGDMQCSACHGSTHAIYPSSHAEDNLQSIAVQGHEGTIAECTACHDTMPRTTSGGPHGMHSVGTTWYRDHRDVAERNPSQCKSCHGNDYRGSVLSKTFSARTFGSRNFAAGHQVSCYDCHNGPGGGD